MFVFGVEKQKKKLGQVVELAKLPGAPDLIMVLICASGITLSPGGKFVKGSL